jgi:hypothetical protein
VTSDDDKGTVQLLEDDITWDGFTIRGIEEPEIGPGMYTSPAHSGYSILNTVFEDNGIGLHLGSDGKHPTVVCGNLFTANNEFEGTGGANGIFSNEGAQDVLIHLGPDSDDALVTGNTALGNGGEDGNFDCQDESKGESATDGTAGTENTWPENVGATADPTGICSAPRRRRPARRRREASRQEAPQAAQGQGPQDAPPEPLRVHPPLLAVLTAR